VKRSAEEIAATHALREAINRIEEELRNMRRVVYATVLAAGTLVGGGGCEVRIRRDILVNLDDRGVLEQDRDPATGDIIMRALPPPPKET
jgi:hypothetical protein